MDLVVEVERGLEVEVVPAVEAVDLEGGRSLELEVEAQEEVDPAEAAQGCPGKRTGGGGRSPRLGGPARGGGRT